MSLLAKLANFFKRDPNRPGKAGLRIVAATYIYSFLIFSLLWEKPIMVLLMVPIMLIFLLFLATPTIAIIGFVTGTPWVSFQWGWRWCKRHFRYFITAALGGGILAAAVSAVLETGGYFVEH